MEGNCQDNYLLLHQNKLTQQFAYLNEKGEIIIAYGKYQIYYTDTFRTLAIVKDMKKGLIAIDRNENYLFNLVDDGSNFISDSMIRIIEGKKIGYADINGKIIIKPQYKCAYPFSNGSALVSMKCKEMKRQGKLITGLHNFNYINKSGEMIMPPRQNTKAIDIIK